MWTCLSNENVCYLAHQRETNLWFLFQRKEKKRLATPSNTTKAIGDCLQPCYGPLGNLPWLRTRPSVVILPALLYRVPPPMVISKFQGTRETFVHSGCFEKFWSSEGGEGGRESRANKESSEDKHARTLAFQQPCPGLMTSTSPTSYKPKPNSLPHGHQEHRHCSLCSCHRDQDPQGQCTERTPTQTGTCEWGVWWPFHGGFSFLRSEPIRRY